MYLDKKDIETLDKVKRINIINSVSGIKPANLIGTISEDNQLNLAIFSSVVHMGSSPALFGFVLRPTGEVPRHTFENIQANGYYTINAIPQDLIQQAHFTSAKFDRDINEFERCGIEEQFMYGFRAPFVARSPIGLGMKMRKVIPIPLNGTVLIIGSVEHLFIQDEIIDENGFLSLDKAKITGIGGLNQYYQLQQIGQFPYARVNEVPNFFLDQ